MGLKNAAKLVDEQVAMETLANLTDEQVEAVVGGIDVSISELTEEVPELREVFPFYIYERNQCPMCKLHGWPLEPLQYNDSGPDKPFYYCSVCHRRYFE